MGYYLGIDVGTSGTKALIMNAKGKVLATATAEHPISAPKPGWSEQHPDHWWGSTVKATRMVIKKASIKGTAVKGIGFSGQMHGLVITDANGKPLRPSLIWNDQRTAKEAAEIEAAVGGRSKLIKLVGNAAQTSFTLTKLLWVRNNEPKIYDKIKHFLLPKDYVRLKMTGEYIGDVSDMSGTLMLNPKTRNWSKKILDTFEIDKSILPPVVESHELTGTLTAAAAKELGLSTDCAVAAGGGDQPVGAVGNGVVKAGLTSATMGTSGVVFTHAKDYTVDPQSRVGTFCASVAGEYCMFGCILAAGGSYQWFRNTLGEAEVKAAKRKGVDPYELLTAEAAQAPAGCEGLFWLPYLTGERTPHGDPNAKACWIGIHSRTSRKELNRSVLEGATFAMNDAVQLLKDRGLKMSQIRLSGGGARSDFWRQLQANIYGTTCATINSEEGPAYGGALLAATGCGEFSSIKQACDSAIKVTRTIKPTAAGKKLYAKLYAQYVKLYPALKDEFAMIAKMGL
jgi:xylulokinase